MGGLSKPTAPLAGKRLIDHVAARLAPQIGLLLVSGSQDFDLGAPVIQDHVDGPRGPVAGLWAVSRWFSESAPDAPGFVTVPVDAPFLPHDLATRLGASGRTAIGVDAQRAHPAFAYWELAALRTALSTAVPGRGLALMKLADLCAAQHVRVDAPNAFFNVNTPEDLARAEELARAV